MDGQYLQGIGSILGGGAAFIGALLALFNQKKIGETARSFIAAMLEPRLSMYERRARTAEQMRGEAILRAESAEHSAENWRESVDAIDQQIESLKTLHASDIAAVRAELEAVKVRNDALVDYSQKILEYSIKLEHRAIAGGIDLADLKMPPIPAIIADRLNIPETLR